MPSLPNGWNHWNKPCGTERDGAGVPLLLDKSGTPAPSLTVPPAPSPSVPPASICSRCSSRSRNSCAMSRTEADAWQAVLYTRSKPSACRAATSRPELATSCDKPRPSPHTTRTVGEMSAIVRQQGSPRASRTRKTSEAFTRSGCCPLISPSYSAMCLIDFPNPPVPYKVLSSASETRGYSSLYCFWMKIALPCWYNRVARVSAMGSTMRS